MKKLIVTTLLLISVNAFAWQIQNPNGSTSYVMKDPSGATTITNGVNTSYVTKDPSGATRVQNSDGSTYYITN